MNQIAAQGVLSDPRMAQEVTRRVLGIEGNPVRAIATPADAATGEAGAIATNTAAASNAQNPVYDLMDKFGMTYDDAKAEAIRLRDKTEADKIRTEDKTTEIEDKTYNRITKIPAYSTYSDIETNFKTLLSLKDQNSRPASVGMIASLARIWDPASTVREGEFALNANAQSALDNIYGDWREIVLGEGRLGDAAKESIIKAAAAKRNDFGKVYQDQTEGLLKSMEKLGGKRENIPVLRYEPYVLPTVSDAPIVKTSIGDVAASKEVGMEAIRQKLALQKARQEKTMQEFGRMYGSK
jgi:hypothetical protein